MINKVGIAGAGAMGAGIAQVFAQAGFQVILFDIQTTQLEKAKTQIVNNLSIAVSKNKLTEKDKTSILSHISFTSNSEQLIGD